MGNTENFGFKTLVDGDSFDQDGYKYTNDDRQLMDRLFLQMMEHDHTGTALAAELSDTSPNLDLETSDGNLAPGLRIYYRYSLVDVNGNESAASPIVYVDTPDPVAEPSVPVLSLASTGGTLLPGTYNYVLTAYTTANTLETKIGGIGYKTVNTGTSTNEITIAMPSLPSGATGFNIYRKGPGNPRYYYLASTTSTSYVDDGSVALTTSRTTPNSNRTYNTNKVIVSYPGATPSVPAGYTWKIYRTFDQSDWSYSLLHHVVEDTSPGIIDVEWSDRGESTSVGSPSEFAAIVSNPGKITLTNASEVEGSLPSGLLTVPYQLNFGQSGVVVEANGVLVWSCEFEHAEITHVRFSLGRDSVAVNDIEFDIKKYDSTIATPAWSTIFDDIPKILTGEWQSELYTSTAVAGANIIPLTRLVRGDALVVDITSANEDVATPTALGLTVSIHMMVKSGSETVSWDWS